MLLTAAVARARPEEPALHWVRGEGAESCIDPRGLAQRVRSIAGPALVSADSADLSIEAHIERSKVGGFTVHLRVSRGSSPSEGERVLAFETSDCRSLDGTIAFLIAVTIDPELGAQGLPDELAWIDEQAPASQDQIRSELLAMPSPVVREPSAEPSRGAPRPASERLATKPEGPAVHNPSSWQAALAIGGGSGPAPSAAAGLWLSVSRRLLAQLQLAVQLNADSALAAHEVGVYSVTTQRFGLGLLTCFDVLRGPLEFELRSCIGPALALVRATGRGFAPNKSTVLASFSGALRLDVRHAFAPHWGVIASGLLHVDPISRRIRYERAGDDVEMFRTRPLILMGSLGVTYEF